MSHLIGSCIEGALRLANNPKKKRFLESADVRTRFEETRDEIEDVLADTAYFHGTGARHYVSDGNSKHDGTTDEAGDSLASLLKNGLVPQEDIYNDYIKTGASASVSLTERRLYARLYAQLFLHEKSSLDYEYGPRPFWWGMFLVRMGINHTLNNLHPMRNIEAFMEKRTPEGRARRMRQWERIQQWTNSFRKDGKYAKRPLSAILFSRTDIPDNHPVIVGVKRGSFEPLPIRNAGFASYETRSGTVIDPKDFTHLQVPLSSLETVRDRVETLGIALPIIPIEFAELIDSDRPLAELVQFHGKQSKA